MADRKHRTVMSLSLNEADAAAMQLLVDKYREQYMETGMELLAEVPDSVIIKSILKTIAWRVSQCEFDYRL